MKNNRRVLKGKAKRTVAEKQQSVERAMSDLRKALGVTDAGISENMRAKLTAVPQARVNL